MYRTGNLGPKGIQSTEEVFIGIGYDGPDCYMGLLVNASGAGGVRPFFRGDALQRCEGGGGQDSLMMCGLKAGLVRALMKWYEGIRDVKLARGRW